MFAVIGAFWCTLIFIMWCGACHWDKTQEGKVEWTNNTFQAVILGGVPLLVFKFFVFILS